jgi:hypothetical protein
MEPVLMSREAELPPLPEHHEHQETMVSATKMLTTSTKNLRSMVPS